jgi:hypothetical protein
MIGLGCMLSFISFWVLVLWGPKMAGQHGASTWAGVAWGLIAWLAVMTGYGAFLTIADWWQRPKFRNREDVPLWGKALIWWIFLTTAVVSLGLGRRLCFW